MPQRAKLKQLATLFGVSTAYLLGEENEKTATIEGDGLTDAQRTLIQAAKGMTDSEALQALAVLEALKVGRTNQDS